MILITGAAGFIGSCLITHLNQLGFADIVVVDEFEKVKKQQNLIGKKYSKKVHRTQLFDWLKINGPQIKMVYHLGARTDTTEKNCQIFHQLNLNYSKRIWRFCVHEQTPLVYASSAATYGLGEYGFKEDLDLLDKLQPLNPYAVSKNDFDIWALAQTVSPPFWAGLKFFNVYGPNEYHKGRMASVIFHTFQQIKKTGKMNLFRSHHPDFKDGEQARDFIYVRDVVQVCTFFMDQQPTSGLYNVGTGQARTFLDLVNNTFAALAIPPNIQFIPTPLDIRATYQYYTVADMQKTRQAGYDQPFYSLEVGVADYVKYYLTKDQYF